jgi:WD40-like Beta Propeller Repeat
MLSLRVAFVSGSLALGLLACGDSKKPGLEQDDVPSTVSDGGTKKPDARKDAGVAPGTKRDSSTAPSTTPMGSNSPAPFELMKVDDCGDDNPGKLSKGDIEKLKAGGELGQADILYPYDKTVFPRGLKAPELMWSGATGKSVYLSIRSTYFEYDGCLAAAADGTLQIPQEVWDNAGKQTLGPNTPFEVNLTVLSSGKVVGPISRKITIAQATLNGSIYYNSYNSRVGAMGGSGGLGGGLLGGLGGGFGGGGGGSVLRIKPGKDAEFFVRQGACTGCHAVSANGERLITKDLGGGNDGLVYAIDTDTAPNPPSTRGTPNGAFVGLSPDGKLFINTAIQNRVGPNTTGAAGTPRNNIDSVLTETDTGTVVANSGVPTTALMPTFSPDGKHLAFNDFAKGGGRGIHIMDFDSTARTASNEKQLFAGDSYAGWPFLLPDNGAVIFTVGDSANFTGNGVGVNGFTVRGPRSDLMIVDATTGKATLLARAMGFETPADADSDNTYLPFGAEELHQHYYPTVSPVAAGGYFWVFFDSVRHYGNKGLHRQLWGAAIAIQHEGTEFNSEDGLYGKDPSYPAFYLPGQELETANHRAFTALDPCLADGEACETGINCCSGFCTNGVCGPPLGCSNRDNACETDDDCCDKNDKCINNFCGQVIL